MARIVVHAFMTLDGVVQAPGGADEDREGGFEHGGWQFDLPEGSGDAELVQEWESKTAALLLGRKTYEIWSQAWAVWDEDAPGQMGELTRLYNRVPKYVASRTLDSVEWKNASLLGDDVPAAVAKLRAQPVGGQQDGEIRVWGSGNLIRTLAEHDLIDEYRLAVYPLVLGTGKKLFPDGFTFARFTLASSRALPSGVVVNEYLRS